MDRSKRLHELNNRMEWLKDQFEQLGMSSIREGERLKNGYLPDPLIMEELSRAGEEFSLLGAELEKLSHELSWSGWDRKTDSLARLQELWVGLAEHLEFVVFLEQQTGKALHFIKRALMMEGEGVKEELKRFHEKLYLYRKILNRGLEKRELSPLLRDLVEEKHPLTALIRLGEEEPVHQEALELFQAAAAEFGASLTLAVTRGTVRFPEHTSEEESNATFIDHTSRTSIGPNRGWGCWSGNILTEVMQTNAFKTWETG